MRQVTLQRRASNRSGERIPFHARLHVTTLDGKPVAPLSRCTNLGLGGLRGVAAEGLAPGMFVIVTLELPRGRSFQARGRVAWSKLTLHPALFGDPRGRDDDGIFGICFEDLAIEDRLPIARILAGRQDERRRARRIRRLHGVPNFA